MKLLKQGKTKSVYILDNGNYLLQFDDRVTGNKEGKLDPGGNQVVAEISGMSLACLSMSAYLFEKIEEEKIIETHLISYDLNKKIMEVKAAALFGKGLEVIVRFVAAGSFVERYADYVSAGDIFKEPLIEITLKNDALGDPLINDQAILALDLLKLNELELIKNSATKIALLIHKELKEKDLNLYDLKVEFGRCPDGNIILIDEISPGSMRVYSENRKLSGLELAAYFTVL